LKLYDILNKEVTGSNQKNQMASGGSRPGSGRPSLIDEGLRSRVISKSWSIIEEFFNDPNESLADKRKTASYLAGKSVPQNINLGGQENNPLNNIISFRWGETCEK
jgi:hypothetical protein